VAAAENMAVKVSPQNGGEISEKGETTQREGESMGGTPSTTEITLYVRTGGMCICKRTGNMDDKGEEWEKTLVQGNWCYGVGEVMHPNIAKMHTPHRTKKKTQQKK